MSLISFNYIYNLLKEAARDIPHFYPEWVRSHPVLERYDTLSEITKAIPVEDYREVAKIDFDQLTLAESALEDKVTSLLEEVNELLISFKRYLNSLRDKSDMIATREKINNFISACNGIRLNLNIEKCVEALEKTDKLSEAIVLADSVISDGFEVATPKGMFKKVLKYEKNINLVSICRVLMSDFKKYFDIDPDSSFDNLKDISTLDSYKELSYFVSKFRVDQKQKSEQQFEIVFSKQPSDLLSMSIRSDWTSCQNLLKDKSNNNVKAIYSAISPYVGIIYLTNKNPYKDRGEEMIARSLVFYLESEKGDEGDPPILYIGKVYSNYDKEYIKNKFLFSLQRHTSLIVESDEKTYYGKYYFPFDKKLKESFHEESFDFSPPSGVMKQIKRKFPILPYFDEKEDRSGYLFPVGTRKKRYDIGSEFDDDKNFE